MLTKLINAELSAYNSAEFAKLAVSPTCYVQQCSYEVPECCVCDSYFCLFISQDRTRSTLLRGLANDLLEKNALILDAVEEEVRP